MHNLGCERRIKSRSDYLLIFANNHRYVISNPIRPDTVDLIEPVQGFDRLNSFNSVYG
jgi:hypothetical protein